MSVVAYTISSLRLLMIFFCTQAVSLVKIAYHAREGQQRWLFWVMRTYLLRHLQNLYRVITSPSNDELPTVIYLCLLEYTALFPRLSTLFSAPINTISASTSFYREYNEHVLYFVKISSSRALGRL